MMWGNSINIQKQLQALKTLDRLAAKAATTITKTPPQTSIELIIDLIPIELMIQKNSYISLPKAKEAISFPTQTKQNKNTTSPKILKDLIDTYKLHQPRYNRQMQDQGKGKDIQC